MNEESRCFVGDVIFAGSVGRSDLPGGDFETLEIQSKKVFTHCQKTRFCILDMVRILRLARRKFPIRLYVHKNINKLPDFYDQGVGQ